MRVLKKNTISRRSYLKGGTVTALGLTVMGPMVIGKNNAWAASFKTIGADDAATLIQMARDTYPHDFLADKYYAKVIEGIEAQDPQSILALDMMAYQIAKTIGSYYIASGTPDAIVFSGGIGENTPELREKVANHLKDLNVQINPKRNFDLNKSGKISEEDSLPMFVIATNEEKQMAILTNELLERLSPCAPS